ncbi:MAG: glutathione binding-like protein [Acidithiobacillus sp.]
MRWLNALLSEHSTIVPRRLTIADIVLFAAIDFGAGVGWPLPIDLPHLARWFQGIADRPSAGFSLHPRSLQTGIHY